MNVELELEKYLFTRIQGYYNIQDLEDPTEGIYYTASAGPPSKTTVQLDRV